MSKYTTQVRFICESSIPLQEQGDYSDINRAIEFGRKKIFTFDYDLFDPEYKPVIESKFLRHFYTREIGLETVALWKLKLEDAWTMKLPYYNKLWESALIKIDPFNDVDYTVEHSGSGTSERNDSGENEKVGGNTASENRLEKFSDTPQGDLQGVIDSDWLTNASQNESELNNDYTENVTNSLESTISNTDSYINHTFGKMNSISYSKLLQDFRDTFINVDERFINEFNDLFMLVY